VSKIIFRPGSKELATLGDGAMVWDATRLADRTIVPLASPLGVAFAADGRLLVVAREPRIPPPGKFRSLQVYELQPAPPFTARALGGPIDEPAPFLWDVHFSHDGRLAALVSLPFDAKNLHAQVRVWDVRAGRQVMELTPPRFNGGMNRFPLAFSPDGKYLATGGKERVTIWDTANGQARHSLPGRAGTAFTSVVYSTDGQQLFSAEENEQVAGEVQVKVWDTTSGEEVRSLRLPAEGGRVMALASSPDGRRLALGRQQSTRISVLDALSGAEVLTLEERVGGLVDIAFSPDGRRIVAGAKVWDATTGLELLTLGKGSGSTGFSPDGGMIAGLDMGGVAIWDGRPPDMK
jgi:WD40 repeat protein